MMIKLQNTSRRNREFMDSFLRYLAVEMNIGSTEINGDLLLNSYTPKFEFDGKLYNWASINQILSKRAIKGINDMLCLAKTENIRNGGIYRFREFIMDNTDLNDCHLTALNDFNLS